MINFISVRLCALLLLSTGVAMAGSPGVWEVFGKVLHLDYREKVDNSPFMKDWGLLYGIGVGYSQALARDVVVAGEFRAATGRLAYHSNGSGNMSGQTDHLLDGQLSLGKRFHPMRVALTPYLGLRLRMLQDDTSGMVTDIGYTGYLRESQYILMPVGMIVDWHMLGAWRASVDVQHDFFVSGQQKSFIDGMVEQNQQASGTGNRIALQMTAAPHHGYAWFVRPYYQYWHIDDSVVSCVSLGSFSECGLEPDNTTHEVGVAVGVEF